MNFRVFWVKAPLWIRRSGRHCKIFQNSVDYGAQEKQFSLSKAVERYRRTELWLRVPWRRSPFDVTTLLDPDLLYAVVSHSELDFLAYGWRAGNLNWPIRIQQAGRILVSWRQVEIRQLLSLETALNIHEKKFTISEIILVGKKWKIWTILCF